jgi:hypothetical protein
MVAGDQEFLAHSSPAADDQHEHEHGRDAYAERRLDPGTDQVGHSHQERHATGQQHEGGEHRHLAEGRDASVNDFAGR